MIGASCSTPGGKSSPRFRALSALDSVIDGFQFDNGRDLTGYVDGTENPKGKKASAAAIVRGAGAGLDGSSFVAVQQWIHDFQRFEAMSAKDQDNAVGRRRSDNKELTGAPRSAHVKRTAQESFSPEAFILRRSMPWTDGAAGGLNFVAFGKSFDAFEAQLKRMVGAEDGITDALFKFTRPVDRQLFLVPAHGQGTIGFARLGFLVEWRFEVGGYVATILPAEPLRGQAVELRRVVPAEFPFDLRLDACAVAVNRIFRVGPGGHAMGVVAGPEKVILAVDRRREHAGAVVLVGEENIALKIFAGRRWFMLRSASKVLARPNQ